MAAHLAVDEHLIGLELRDAAAMHLLIAHAPVLDRHPGVESLPDHEHAPRGIEQMRDRRAKLKQLEVGGVLQRTAMSVRRSSGRDIVGGSNGFCGRA